MYTLPKSKAQNRTSIAPLKSDLFSQNALLRYIKLALLIATFGFVNSIPLLTFSSVLIDLELTLHYGLSFYAAFSVR